MKINVGQDFFRDDYTVRIANIGQFIDADTGDELWKVDTIIYIDGVIFEYHGFRTQTEPSRRHLTHYMDVLVPEMLARDPHKT